MTLKEYTAFITSVEQGSISKAATVLGSTQSALTHLIINMENEFGFSVMKRNKAGITLTEEGKRIYQAVKNVISSNKKVELLAKKIKGENTNQINIATFTSVAVNWLPSIMNGFKKIHPEIEFTFEDGNYDDINTALEYGIADVGFVTLPASANLKCYPLVNDRILAILPNNHPLSSLNSIPVEKFAIEPVISLPSETDFDSRKVFEKANITPNIIYRTNDDYAMISMVENGLGISLVPELLLAGKSANINAVETNPPSQRTIALAIPYEKQSNPLTNEFANYIIKWVKQNCKNAII